MLSFMDLNLNFSKYLLINDKKSLTNDVRSVKLDPSTKGGTDMDMNGDKSISLSQCCVVLFALLLAALDIGGYWFVGFFIRLRGMVWQSGVLMLVSIYTGSVFGWVTLWKLWNLLGNIKAGHVFVDDNVRIMRTVSRCCAAAAVISALSALYYAPFFVIAMAAAFMALIVRIVRNVFQTAIEMKDELDYTV